MLMLSILLSATSLSFAQDKYQQFFSKRILATKIPLMNKNIIEKKLHPVKYQDLRNFSLVRVKSTISGIEKFNNLSISGSNNTPRLRFLPGSRHTKFRPGDWLRIINITQTDVAELEASGGQIGISSYSGDASIYSMIALKMSADFKTSEFFVLNAMAAPGDEVSEVEIFDKDILATAQAPHIKNLKRGDVLISSSEMKFGNHGRELPANTPLVVESTSYERQPWRLVWKYKLQLRIINCPEEFKADNCRGTYEDEYLRKPLVFMGQVFI